MKLAVLQILMIIEYVSVSFFMMYVLMLAKIHSMFELLWMTCGSASGVMMSLVVGMALGMYVETVSRKTDTSILLEPFDPVARRKELVRRAHLSDMHKTPEQVL